MTQRTRRRPLERTLGILLLAGMVATGCAGRVAPSGPTGGAPVPVFTVPEIAQMIRQGERPAVIIGEIQRSGTVYRLTPEQATALRADGSPASLLSLMQLTYDHAVEQSPALATSNAQWHQIGNYWYGGTPFGWPREWVVGAPAFGAAIRRGAPE